MNHLHYTEMAREGDFRVSFRSPEARWRQACPAVGTKDKLRPHCSANEVWEGRIWEL